MRLTIGLRIFLALTTASLIVLTLNAVVTRWNFERGFLEYVGQQELATINETAATLAAHYRGEGEWDEFGRNPRHWTDLLRQSSRPPSGRPPAGRPPQGGQPVAEPPPGASPPRGATPVDPLDLGRRISLTDADGHLVVGRTGLDDAAASVAVVVDGETVGFVTIAPRRELTDQLDREFAREQERSIYLIALAALVLAALVSAIVARQLTRPIRSLSAGARAISDGAFDTRIPEDRDDELGDLAHEFNSLAQRLEQNRVARRQWVADIAHELRTPLAILRGELEAIEDGVRSLDEATLRSLGDETARLTALVGELHELSVLDEGGQSLHVERVDVAALLAGTLNAARGRLADAGLGLADQLPAEAIVIDADADQLDRVFSNLVENALRYTDAPGRIEVTLERDGDGIAIEFADSAPGVPAGMHEKLFDRLCRFDVSRSRSTGGSGLGLAICKAIVEAHGGTIAASASALGGVAIRIRLPIVNSGDVVT